MNFSFPASYVALWALVVFQALLTLVLLRNLSELRQIIEQKSLPGQDGLPLGARAPEFVGRDLRSGRRVSIRDFDRRGGIILFLSACEMCINLVESLQQFPIVGRASIVAFCQGGDLPCARVVKSLGPNVRVLLKSAEQTADRYRVATVPTAVVIDGQQVIRGYGHPQNAEQLADLVDRSLGERQRESDPKTAQASVLSARAVQ